MKKQYNTKSIILVPFFIALIMLVAIVHSYMQMLNNDIDDEYRTINAKMQWAVKILVALDYGFTNYFESPPILSSGFNKTVSDGLCRITPNKSLLVTNNSISSLSPIGITYMVVGDTSLCDDNNPLYESVRREVYLAPIISFLHDQDDYILGVQYIDKAGYIIASPDSAIKNISKEQLQTIKQQQFWLQALQHPKIITTTETTVANAAQDPKNEMMLTMPIYQQDELGGVVLLTINVRQLIGDTLRLASRVKLVKPSELPSSASLYRLQPLEVSYTQMDYYLYYHWDWAAEFNQFVKEKQTSLFALLLAYLFSVVGLFYFNTRIEKSYYENLAIRDPMTGLLNRRGMKEFLQDKQHRTYLSVAVLDIDNFKSINDTYGHDVGDKVICYMGTQIESNIRDTDAVARFGGEEFVVYLTSSDPMQMEAVMQRIKDAITQGSKQVVPAGFTISGGVERIESESGWHFDQLFKLADKKLYQAKTSGKDKLVF